MAKYRKKPVVIEAEQVTAEMCKQREGDVIFFTVDQELRFLEWNNDHVIIETLEGTMLASIGDYIITGVKGEKYPCKPDIFEQTYELEEA